MPKKNYNTTFLFLFVLLTWVLIGPSIKSASATTTLFPIADTYVYERYPDTNYGGGNYLEIGNWDAGKNQVYFKFDLTSISEVIRTRLFVYTTSHSVTGNLTLHEVTDTSWNEYTLTWNNRPSFDPNILDWQLAVSNGQWLVFDITSLAQMRKGGLVSLILVSHSSVDDVKVTNFFSREYSIETKRPHLAVETETSQLIPELSSPPDKTIFYGTIGNTITWEASDNNPDFYTIFRDGIPFDEGLWNGSSISTIIDGLDLGTYEYELFLNDTDGNTITDALNVYVLESANLFPNADTYVYERYPDTNYGGDNYLEIGNWDAGKNLVYMKFDLSNIATISRVRLFLYTTSHSVTGNLTLHEVPDTSWNEYTLTWNNRPSFNPNILDWQLAVSNGQWLEFDMTSLAQMRKGGFVSVILVAHSSVDDVKVTNFFSREYSIETKRPYITVDTETSQQLPELSNPPDKTIFYGTTGNTITWEVSDNNPDFYTIFRDGIPLDEGLWNGSSISTIIDGLDLGTYEYELFLNDTDGNSVSDVIYVNVIFKGSHILNPVADTYAYERYPDTNYGGDNYLEIGNWDAGKNLVYMKFYINPVAVISQAKLNIITTSFSSTGNLTLHEVTDTSWNEYTLTWNNRPSFNPNILDWQLAVSNGQWLTFDISSLLQTMNGGLLSLILVSHSSGDNVKVTNFISREYSIEEKNPYLNLSASGTFPPEVTISNPTNQTYLTNDIWLNFAVNTSTSWVGYSLDNNQNVTISGSTLLTDLSEGSHSIIVYASDIFGNCGLSSKIFFTIDTPPTIEFVFPLNITYIEDHVWLNFSIDQSTDWIGYSLDGAMNITVTDNVSLTSLSDGSHFVVIYTNDSFGSMVSAGPVWFSIDTTPPGIFLSSPLNTTYITSDIWLSLSFNKSTSWIAYSLDGNPNITISGSTFLIGLSDGSHLIFVYAQDIFGHIASSDISFTIDTPPDLFVLSPSSGTYSTSSLWLNFTIDESADWIGYSLDGGGNMTIFGNTLLSSLPEGSHSIVIFTNDSFGSMVSSGVISFAVDTIPPEITLFQPSNTTYTTSSIFVDFEINEAVAWSGYSLDSAPNVTIMGDFWLNSLSQGSHTIVLYSIDEAGNQNSSDIIWFTIDTPPVITLFSPINTTYSAVNISFDISINEPVTWIGYSLDGMANVTVPAHILNNLKLTFLEEGCHSVTVFSSDSFGNIGSSGTIWFSIDTILPTILISNPINSTYSEDTVWLTFTIDESTSWLGYSLDGMANITITDNIKLTNLQEGSHYVVIYALDFAGNVGVSKIIWFTVNLPEVTYTTTYTSAEISSTSSSRSPGFFGSMIFLTFVSIILKRKKH